MRLIVTRLSVEQYEIDPGLWPDWDDELAGNPDLDRLERIIESMSAQGDYKLVHRSGPSITNVDGIRTLREYDEERRQSDE